jgi:hypothetical protein
LIDLGYDFDEGEDFSETSINEGRRWNEYIGKWYLREFDGLGYQMHIDNKRIDF